VFRDDLRRERDDWKEQAQRLALAAPIAPGSCTGDARTSACARSAAALVAADGRIEVPW